MKEKEERQRQYELELKDKENTEKEKERQYEAEMKAKEAEMKEQERQYEDRKHEREFSLRQLEVETDIEIKKMQASRAPAPVSQGTGGPGKTAYIPKLPPFDESTDDIDSFLFRFENHAVACGWPKDKWSLYIASLFKGSALVLYHTLAADKDLTWDQLKEELLKKFQCSAERFRERFRSARPEKGESFPSFLIRMSHYLDRWVELTKTDTTFKDLRDLLLREQLYYSVSKDVATFLRERDFDKVEDMCKMADQYRIAHPEKTVARKSDSSFLEANLSAGVSDSRGQGAFSSQNSRYPNQRNQWGKRTGQNSSGPSRPQFIQSGQARGTPSGRRGFQHQRGRGRGAFVQPQSGDPPRCYACEGLFHLKRDCPFRDRTTKPSCVSTDVKEGHVLAPQQSVDGLHLEAGSVNGLEASVLRDTGCTTAGVKKSLVSKDQYLGTVQKCRSFGGHVECFPLADILIDTPYFSGTITACVIDNPVCDLILGNLPGIKTVHGGAGGSFVPCLVSTRAQQEKDKRPTKQLKIPDFTELSVTPSKLAQLQKDDVTLKNAFSNARQSADGVNDGVNSDVPYFIVMKDILYRCVPDKDTVRQQVVVPTELRPKVLFLGHDALFAGHCGVKRTLQRILQSFFWPGVTKCVTEYCRSCDICQKTTQKGRIPCAPLHKMPLISVPFSKVAIDLVGPFPPSSSGNRYILTLVDTATRYPEAIPLKKIDTVTVAEALLSVFARMGLPNEILSDCGTQFVSDLMKEIYRLLSISSITTTPYHPQSNGMVERFNGTLKSMLRKVTRQEPKEWDRFVPSLLFAYRELPNETLGFSPFELLFGHSPRGPLELLASNWCDGGDEPKTSDSDNKNVYQYVFELHNRIKDACELAQQSADKKSDVYKDFADRKAKARSLSVGDRVLVLLTDEHNKLRVSWKGPYLVVSKETPVNYSIQMGNRVKTFHINMLKQYVERTNVAINQSVICPVVQNDACHDVPNIISPSFEPDIQYKQREPCVQTANVGFVTKDNTDDVVTLPILSVTGETYENVVISHDLSFTQVEELNDILKEFQDVLTDSPGKVTNVDPHSIHLTSDKPIRIKPYPLPFAKKEVVEKEIKVMLDLGVIEPSSSPYSSPVVLVDKPDGSVRFCIDYRQLNKVTVFDAEPIPDIEELLCQLSEGKFFVKIDLTKGYWQIPMSEADKEKTAFQTPFGLYHWTRMPFGLQNAPATFARMMRILRLHECGAVSFFDDILIAPKSWPDLLYFLRAIFLRLREFGLTARPSKIRAGFRSLEFLGHTISVGKMMPELSKVKKILTLKKPTTKKQVRSLLGLLSYYRRYVPHFATLTSPLTDLTKGDKGKSIVWSDDCQKALEDVQSVLNQFPVLLLPSLTEDFILRTDASSKGMGAVLLQEKNGLLHPVQYASKKFSDTQGKYSTIERECLAVVWGCEKFARFLIGRHFRLQTDHRPLTFLQSSKSKNSRLLRWALALQEYCFTVEPVPGTVNIFADLLSRD